MTHQWKYPPGDLRNIFDAFLLVDREMQRKAKLAADLENARKLTIPKCGNCCFWMKSSLCPYEKNVNGWNRGPSMNGHPCGKHEPMESFLADKKKYEAMLAENSQ